MMRKFEILDSLKSVLPERRLILDFDGVVCDSAFEAFRIMLVAAGNTDSPLDPTFDDIYKDFARLRPRVSPAWNYYYVAEEILRDNVIEWSYTEPAALFERRFLETRS